MRSPARTNDAPELAAVVVRAKNGDADALDALVRALQHDIYRLALRMTAQPHDAEDATQEILIKVVTRLDSFRGEASVRTWAYRVAIRHLLDRRKSRVEALALTFAGFGADLLEGLAAAPDPDPVAVEEVKRGCTMAMLTCLDRDHRLAFILSDVFGVSNSEAAGLCEVSDVVYRQRLSRARRTLESFTRSYCGLVSDAAPCQCGRRVARAERLGRLRRDSPEWIALPAADLTAAIGEMEQLHDAARLMRRHPDYLAPAAVAERIRRSAGGMMRHAP